MPFIDFNDVSGSGSSITAAPPLNPGNTLIASGPSTVFGISGNNGDHLVYNTSNKEVKRIYDGAGMNTIHLSTSEMKIKKDDQRVFRCVITSISPDTIDVYSYRNDMTG